MKEPVEVVQATGQETFRGVPGASDWEETLRHTQNMPEGLYIFPGLGTPWDPPQEEPMSIAGDAPMGPSPVENEWILF